MTTVSPKLGQVRAPSRVRRHGLSGWKPAPNELVLASLAVLAALLWIYVLLRAMKVPFTIDEAGTYGIIHGDPTLADSANNQWLNTLLMRASQDVFGQSELALRLPNVLAFGLYGACCLALLGKLRHSAARVLGFVLLLGDPFLLEFFGLARGYGLCLAFSAAALAVLYAGARSPRREPARLLAIGAAANLALYANFAALNFVLGLLAVLLIDAVIPRVAAHEVKRGSLLLRAAIVCVSAAALVPGVLHIRHLQANNQLYYGGDKGFVVNTIGSLVETWRYRYEPPAPTWLVWSIALLAALALAWALIRCVRKRRWGNSQRAALVFVIAVLAAVTESKLLGTLYPIDRTALTYILAFAALMSWVVDDLLAVGHLRVQLALGAVAACALVLAGLNFASSANMRSALTWTGDASARKEMDAVVATERRYGPPLRRWTLISGFPRNYALDYYRSSRGLRWLAPITRAPVSTRGGNLYVVSVGEVSELPAGTELVATFPATGTELRVGPALAHRRHSTSHSQR